MLDDELGSECPDIGEIGQDYGLNLDEKFSLGDHFFLLLFFEDFDECFEEVLGILLEEEIESLFLLDFLIEVGDFILDILENLSVELWMVILENILETNINLSSDEFGLIMGFLKISYHIFSDIIFEFIREYN